MGIYRQIYYRLCESKKQSKEQHVPGSGLHKHHIIPKHSGGSDDEDNFTYLSVREHIIAHFLLWKIHGNPNDLRAMKMLGAELSVEYRRKIGEYCRDNSIGFFGASDEQRQEWRNRGVQTQKSQDNSFYFWSTEEGRKKRASMGGKEGSKVQIQNGIGIHNPDNFIRNATLGGKAIKDMICVTNGKHRTRIRPEKLDEYLAMGYVKGFTLSS
jgi:hypothetical protein